MRADAVFFGLALALATPAASQDGPLSAIDWLSDALTRVPEAPPVPNDLAEDASVGAIRVVPLDGQSSDAAGLLPPSVTGLPQNLWGPADAADLARQIAGVPQPLLPALQRLLTSVLLAEADPPAGAENGGALFIARAERLVSEGKLEEAAALLDRAGGGSPERFALLFDVALLTGAETAACETLALGHVSADDYATRVFCLARTGDWPAAALTLASAEALGLLAPETTVLLARFLDPEFSDSVGGLPPERAPSPLEFRLWEAIGEPLPTTSLPLPFATWDLQATNGWKARLDAAERLARAGALSGGQLVALYTERRPSASGGVWDRADAVQKLDAALEARDRDATAAILPDLWNAAGGAGLLAPLAQVYGPRLSDLRLDGLAGTYAFRLGLLSPDYELAAAARVPETADEAYLVALALGNADRQPGSGPLREAISDGFAAQAPPPALADMLARGEIGTAILTAITLFAEGAEGDPDRVADAVALFRALGLESTARRASLELLVLAAAS
ncbi:MAG: hypothetical protein AAFR35_12405 [Pseudomonadota bacterium]